MKRRLDSEKPSLLGLQQPLLAGLLIFIGMLLTLTIVGAFLGIPMTILGIVILVRPYV